MVFDVKSTSEYAIPIVAEIDNVIDVVSCYIFVSLDLWASSAVCLVLKPPSDM